MLFYHCAYSAQHATQVVVSDWTRSCRTNEYAGCATKECVCSEQCRHDQNDGAMILICNCERSISTFVECHVCERRESRELKDPPQDMIIYIFGEERSLVVLLL